jgi:hypothetical protein
MYTLTIIREPYESSNNATAGEVNVFQSTDKCVIERNLKDYLRAHLYLFRTDPHESYGDIMFFVTHNGTIIDIVNYTDNMKIENFTPTDKPFTRDFDKAYRDVLYSVNRNNTLCSGFKVSENKTRQDLDNRYKIQNKKESEIEHLHYLLSKYPNEVKNVTSK